ncbi:unnamed protein product, partial [Iphiclides podalirius]
MYGRVTLLYLRLGRSHGAIRRLRGTRGEAFEATGPADLFKGNPFARRQIAADVSADKPRLYNYNKINISIGRTSVSNVAN